MEVGVAAGRSWARRPLGVHARVGSCARVGS